MKIFSTPELRRIDQYTIEHEPVSSIDLMERAASAIVYKIASHWGRRKHICLFAGPGNNGGDALAVARLLMVEGYAPEVYLFNTSRLSDDCNLNKERLLTEFPDAHFNEIVREFRPPRLDSDTLVIDGLFGSGMNKPMMGGYTSLVEYINESGAYVISIDIPSGLMCDWEQKNDPRHIIRANETYTFQFPKLSFFFRENAQYVGNWQVLDIGLHPDAISDMVTRFHCVEAADVRKLLHERERFSDKWDYGHALLVGGRYGMVGATLLAAKAALRTGVGLVSVHAPRCANVILQTAVPEALFEPDNDDFVCSEVTTRRQYDAIGIGCGMGRSVKSTACLRSLLAEMRQPAVYDADALNILASHKDLIDLLPKGTIITPHVHEFERLFKCVIDTDAHRLQQAIAAAGHYSIVVVLKGAHTAVVTPQGEVFFNMTGNPGMATAGSGDVLTGMLTALLTQGYAPEQAAMLGVYLHGLAGDIAVAESSEEAILAQDIVACIGKAFKRLRSKDK